MTTDLNASHSDTWDAPLPTEHKPAWENWCNSLRSLQELKVPRSYSNKPLRTAARTELHTFCDASEKAIGAVSYLRTIQPTGEVQVTFVLGKAKLTPAHATTIPRLELCAANPADLATRSVEAKDLKESTWHTGPKFLYNSDLTTSIQEGNIAAEVLADDPEERSDVKALATKVEPCTSLGSERFSRFSQWSTLQGAVAKLITVAQSHSKARVEEEVPSTLVYEQAKVIILRSVQYEAFRKDIECLKRSEKLPSTSPLANLCPVLDKDGLLRVGGRLNEADISNGERHPLILPKSCHTSELIINHYHGKVQHQGRVFTHGLIRSSGYWIIGGKRMVNSIIDKCLKCKKLRGQRQTQKMADLPVDRVSPAPPFSYVGLDVFGPWQVCARRTRGGLSNAKRWAVLFTCLSSRAIHIEVIESMDTSSFINALRRFLALRGPVIQIRSDCGSNFVGARNELQGVLTPSDVSTTRSYLLKEGCEWVFNPPHASHAGGAWERMIGVTRRVLEAVLADVPSRHLTHEVLTTLMAEVSAIVNARPLVPVSSDPDAPEILTPATLLTQKPQQLKQPPGEFNATDLYSKQWKRVQHLANVFWSRWRKEYLPTLQPRRKWQDKSRNLQEGDLVLLCSKDAPRNDWPLARVAKAQPDRDGKVRKVDLITAKEGSEKHYHRPITECILLKADESKPSC
ncbi:hypothetical protein ACROYT_G011194 [Oculina patagonica]